MYIYIYKDLYYMYIIKGSSPPGDSRTDDYMIIWVPTPVPWRAARLI